MRTPMLCELPYANSVGGRPVDFLLNISNDGWFDGTAEHDEHLAICRFRAIECRRGWRGPSTWAFRL